MKVYSVGFTNYNASGSVRKLNSSKQNIPQNPVPQPQVSFEGSLLKALFGFKDNISPVLKEAFNISETVKTTYKYFESNAGKKLVSKLEETLDGEFIAFTKYKYKPNSEQNQLMATYNFDKNNKLLWATQYKYNEFNLVSETANLDARGNLLHRTEYSYSNTVWGRWLEFTKDFDKDGKEIKRVRYYKPESHELQKGIGRKGLSVELIKGEREIEQFVKEHEAEMNILNSISQKLKGIIPEKFHILRGFNPDGHLTSTYLVRQPDISSFDVKEGMKIIGEQGVLYNEFGNVDKVVINHRFVHHYGYNTIKSPEELTRKAVLQELYSPDGNLLESFWDCGYKRYFYGTDKVQEIIERNSSGAEYGRKEFYPSGEVKVAEYNWRRYGDSGSTGETMQVTTWYDENGNYLNRYERYVGDSNSIKPWQPVNLPNIKESSYYDGYFFY